MQDELFPDECFGWNDGRCRNKVRVKIPVWENTYPGHIVWKPSCVKHADRFQNSILERNATLLWAQTRELGEPD